MSIKNNAEKLLQEIKNKNISFVCVTKSRSIDEIKDAIDSGVNIIAENRIPESEEKYELLKDILEKKNVKFHFIGKLQSNKVKKAVALFDIIQSVDSLELTDEIDKRAKQLNKIQECFIEINIGKEKQKSGIMPENAFGLIAKVKELKNVKLTGLMCIPPYSENPEDSRKYFREMKKIFDKTQLKYLSMGMSQNYKIAIEESSNMIRIGRGIFN